MLLSLVTRPAVTPVTLAEAKAHLRIEHTLDDALIETLIDVATAELDGRQGWLRRALITQTWDYSLRWFPVCRYIEIPFPPLQEIVSLTYYDVNDALQTFDASKYEVVTDDFEGRLVLRTRETWPAATYLRELAVTIRFTAGYGDAETDVPANIRQAMLLRVGELYVGRGDEGAIPVILNAGAELRAPTSQAIRRLLAPSRCVVLA